MSQGSMVLSGGVVSPQVSPRAVRSESIVLLPAPFDDHLDLLMFIEDLTAEQFISQFSN